MSNSKMRFGLVGCGAIVKKHIAAISRIKNAEIAGVCDVNEAVAKNIGQELDVKWFSSPQQMAEEVDLDVFSILTPSGSHAKIMLDLVHYKKHFVVEKPMALRIEDADKVLEECDHNAVKIFVVKQNRFNKPVQKLKEAIEAGRFGKLVLGTVRVRWCRRQDYYDAKPWRGTWEQDGGVLTNQASHHIDLLYWMMGDVDSVTAMTSTRLSRIEAEDTGIAMIRFANGALGIVEATTATRPKDLEGSITVLGEKGSVEIGGFFANELKVWNFEEPHAEDEEIFEKWGHNPKEMAWNHEQYLRDVITSISEGHKGLVDGLEGRKSLEMINAIYESAELGKEIRLRFKPRLCRLGMGKLNGN